jgi:hypothetical protein
MTVSTRVCCSMISLTHVPYAVTTRRSSDEDECVDAAGGLTRALAFVEKNFEIRGCFGLVAAVFCPGVAAVLPLYGGGSPRQGSLRRFASYLYTRRAAASLWSAYRTGAACSSRGSWRCQRPYHRSSSVRKPVSSSWLNEWKAASVWLRKAASCGAAAAPLGVLAILAIRPPPARRARRVAGASSLAVENALARGFLIANCYMYFYILKNNTIHK